MYSAEIVNSAWNSKGIYSSQADYSGVMNIVAISSNYRIISMHGSIECQTTKSAIESTKSKKSSSLCSSKKETAKLTYTRMTKWHLSNDLRHIIVASQAHYTPLWSSLLRTSIKSVITASAANLLWICLLFSIFSKLHLLPHHSQRATH